MTVADTTTNGDHPLRQGHAHHGNQRILYLGVVTNHAAEYVGPSMKVTRKHPKDSYEFTFVRCCRKRVGAVQHVVDDQLGERKHRDHSCYRKRVDITRRSCVCCVRTRRVTP